MDPIAPHDAVAAAGTGDAGMPAGIVGGGAPDKGAGGMRSPLARRILSQGRTSRLMITERVTMGAGAFPDLAEFRQGQQRGDRRDTMFLGGFGQTDTTADVAAEHAESRGEVNPYDFVEEDSGLYPALRKYIRDAGGAYCDAATLDGVVSTGHSPGCGQLSN